MKISPKFNLSLSVDSIEEYKKTLMEYKKNLPQIACNIANTLAEEVGQEDNYPVQIDKATIENPIARMYTTDSKYTFQEFGTGIIGSNNPHLPAILSEVG